MSPIAIGQGAMRLLAVTLALLTTTSPVQAQQTPSQTVQAALDAVAKRDWRALANLVDSSRLVEFRREQLGFFVEWAQRKDEFAASERTSGGWGFSGIDSLTPADIARVKDVRLPGFGRERIGALAELSPREFYARYTEAAARNDASDPVWAWSTLKRQLVGELSIGDTVAYVIYRREARQMYDAIVYHYLPGEAEIAPLRHTAQGWKLLLHDDLQHPLAIFDLVSSDREERVPAKKALRDSICPSLVMPPAPASPPKRSASDALRAAFDANDRADWTALAALVHPMMLPGFKRDQLSEIITWAEMRKHHTNAPSNGISLILPRSEDTTLTPDLADIADVRVPIYPDSLSIADLAATAPEKFFALSEAAVHGASPHVRLPNDSVDTPRRIIGEIREADGFVHVLYAGGPFRYEDRYRVTRMPMLRRGDDWGLLLNDDIGDRSTVTFALMMLEHAQTDSVQWKKR